MTSLGYFQRIVDAYAADAGPTDVEASEGGVHLSTTAGVTVDAYVTDGHWLAHRRRSGLTVTPLEDGPLLSAPDASVVEWLRRICDAERDENVRSYVIGLPVIITVHPDGRVVAGVDLSEADDLDDFSGSQPDGLTYGQLQTDIRRVREAIDAGIVEVTRG